MKCSMDSLKFACSWSGSISGARVSVKIGKLQLEGCSFDGSRLSENLRDSPSVSEIPPCVVAWIPKVTSSICHNLPLYQNVRVYKYWDRTSYLLTVSLMISQSWIWGITQNKCVKPRSHCHDCGYDCPRFTVEDLVGTSREYKAPNLIFLRMSTFVFSCIFIRIKEVWLFLHCW